MLFSTFRLIFWGIVFGVCFNWIKKSNLVNKRRFLVILPVVITILCTVSALIPIENAFVTFPSPESSYNYNKPGKVSMVIEGEETDFVLGIKGEDSIMAIIPKSDNGWKLGMGFDTKRVFLTVSGEISIRVYRYKNSDDYYIGVHDMNGYILEITDNHGDEFKCFKKNTNNMYFENACTYYAYINDFNDQYILTVNGKEIDFKN